MWDLIRALRAAAFFFSDVVVGEVGDKGDEGEGAGVSLFEKRCEKNVIVISLFLLLVCCILSVVDILDGEMGEVKRSQIVICLLWIGNKRNRRCIQRSSYISFSIPLPSSPFFFLPLGGPCSREQIESSNNCIER